MEKFSGGMEKRGGGGFEKVGVGGGMGKSGGVWGCAEKGSGGLDKRAGGGGWSNLAGVWGKEDRSETLCAHTHTCTAFEGQDFASSGKPGACAPLYAPTVGTGAEDSEERLAAGDLGAGLMGGGGVGDCGPGVG